MKTMPFKQIHSERYVYNNREFEIVVYHDAQKFKATVNELINGKPPINLELMDLPKVEDKKSELIQRAKDFISSEVSGAFDDAINKIVNRLIP
jgi:hypothetical protein